MSAVRGSVLVLSVALAGCFTTENAFRLGAQDTRVPVSASDAYLASDGTTVRSADYRVVRSFELRKELVGERHDRTRAELRLEPELDAETSRSSGDAITRLRVDTLTYEDGSHRSAATWKLLGYVFGASGAILGGFALDADGRTAVYPAVAFGGLAIGSFVLAAVSNEPSRWSVRVRGDVVKRTTPPPAEPTP